MTVVDLLAGVGLFAGLSPEDTASLAATATTRELRRGEVLFREGDPSDCVYVVGTGRLKVTVTSPRGDKLVLSVLGPGEALGELSVLDGEHRSAGVEALEETEVVAVPAEVVDALLQTSPTAALSVARELAAIVRRQTGAAADMVFLDLPRRLAKLVVTVAGDAMEADLGMTQSDIARQLGVTRQSVNRALSALQRRGWVSVQRGSVLLLDAPALRRFSES